jgi:hypothetical protein
MTNPINSAEVILKTDERGRVQTPVDRRENLLDEFERSGLSAAKFAALAGVKGDVFFRWETSRAATCLDHLIPVTFTGTLQCDGYAAYPAFAKGRGDTIKLADCYAHVRRKFFEAAETGSPLRRDRKQCAQSRRERRGDDRHVLKIGQRLRLTLMGHPADRDKGLSCTVVNAK